MICAPEWLFPARGLLVDLPILDIRSFKWSGFVCLARYMATVKANHSAYLRSSASHARKMFF